MGELLPIYVKAFRAHHQVKNLLVFVPVFTAHKIGNVAVQSKAALAFLSFSLCTSSVYLLNDYLDRQSDRRHPLKKSRPFASGELPVAQGLSLIPLLVLAAFAIASLLPANFLATLGAYYLMTLVYSLWLKRVVIADVVLLAGAYTIRIVAGLTATSLEYSFWLLAFSLFIFLSLALVKRYSELIFARVNSCEHVVQDRGYALQDMDVVLAFGTASGYLAVLILALYLNSNEVTRLYDKPRVLWLLCPIVLFWISRVWIITHRGEMNDDPVVFALKDTTSIVTAIVIVAAVLLAV